MATDQEVYKVILQAEGQEKVQKLATALRQAEEQLKRDIAALGVHDAATRATAAAVANLSQSLASAENSLRQVGVNAKATGQILTQAGYVVDDLQYGFKGVANNIQPLLSAIPGLHGFASAISIGAIAGYQLYEHWDQLAKLWGGGATRTEAEEMDQLGKATKRTADEEQRYQQLKERDKNRQAQNQAPAAVSSYKDQINEAIRNGPKGEIDKGIDKHFGAHIQNMADLDPSLVQARQKAKGWQDKIAEWEGAGVSPDNGNLVKYKQEAKKAAAAVAEQTTRAYAEARERFRLDLGNPDQAGNLKKLRQAASNHPDDFGPGGQAFAKALPKSTPEEDAREKKRAEAAAQDKRDLLAQRENKAIDKAQNDKFREGANQVEEQELKAAHDRDEARRKEASRFSGDAAAGPLGHLATMGRLSDAAVKRGMRRAGYSEEDTGRLAPHAARMLRERGDASVRARAARDGSTFDAARQAIGREHDQAEGARLTGDGRTKADDGARDTVGHVVAAALGAGGSLQGAQKQLFASLRGQYGDGMASMLVRRGSEQGMQEHADNIAGRRKNSQVVDTAGLADSIQAAVGGGADYQKQAVDQLKKANDALNKMLSRPSSTAPILQR